MKKATLSLILIVASVGGVARANEFDDRAELASRKRIEQPLREKQNQVYNAEWREIVALKNFIAAHSGAKSDPTCTISDIGYRCIGDGGGTLGCYVESAEEMGVSTKGPRDIKLSKLKPSHDYSISSCDLSLRNGLACRVSLNGYKENPVDATCYDKSGKIYQYSTPDQPRRTGWFGF